MPIVDCCIGLDSLDKYNSKNILDKLENFWLSINMIPYIFCYKCNKGLGMNKLCLICKQYRISGNII